MNSRATIAVVAIAALGASLAALTPSEPASPPQIRGIGNAPAAETPVYGYVITKPVAGSNIPADYTFVLTRDEVFVAVSVRKPTGNGPFPAILVSSGNGAGGMRTVERQTERLATMFDRMIARGYVMAYIEPRNEVPFLYGKQGRAENVPDSVSGGQRTLKSTASLDSDDFISGLQYLASLPFVDKDAVGAMGVSHSGELILKAASEYTFACGVPIEGAANEFLDVDIGPDAPRKDNEIQFQDVDLVRQRANKAVAMERINRIKTPLLVIGRDDDHQQGIFRLTYEWLKEAGRDVQWATFDHPVHGYPFMYRQEDGSFKPDPIQEKAFETFMAYFDAHLKHPQHQAKGGEQ